MEVFEYMAFNWNNIIWIHVVFENKYLTDMQVFELTPFYWNVSTIVFKYSAPAFQSITLYSKNTSLNVNIGNLTEMQVTGTRHVIEMQVFKTRHVIEMQVTRTRHVIEIQVFRTRHVIEIQVFKSIRTGYSTDLQVI